MTNSKTERQILTQIILVAMIASFASFSFAKAAKSDAWIQRARKVGQSETVAARENALKSLKKQKNLGKKLTLALETSNRPLALDAISALQMKSLVPELQKRVHSDEDGFLVLTLSSLLDTENKDSILTTYNETLEGDVSKLSAGSIVAMLEPLGRLGHELSKDTISKLSSHVFPEVRSALLYYLRALALQHKKRGFDPTLIQLLGAQEFQIRLQAVSIIKEINSQPEGHTPVLPNKDLEKRCEREKPQRIKDQCFAFIRGGQA